MFAICLLSLGSFVTNVLFLLILSYQNIPVIGTQLSVPSSAINNTNNSGSGNIHHQLNCATSTGVTGGNSSSSTSTNNTNGNTHHHQLLDSMVGNFSTSTSSTASDIHNGNGLSQQVATSSYVSLASSSLPLSLTSMTQGEHLPTDSSLTSIDSTLEGSRFSSILPPHPPNPLQLLHQEHQQQHQHQTSNLPSAAAASSLASMIQVNCNANKYPSTPSSSIIGASVNDSNGTSTSSTNGNYQLVINSLSFSHNSIYNIKPQVMWMRSKKFYVNQVSVHASRFFQPLFKPRGREKEEQFLLTKW